jgi:L-lysine 6-transaminase
MRTNALVKMAPPAGLAPGEVFGVLRRHMLVDGFHIVVDLEKSRGARVFDAATGKWYLDFYTFFASSPVGINHPKMRERGFLDRLVRAAVNKPANSDAYTVELAEFVATLERLAMPSTLPYLFLVEGGAPAVENALKTAFDWKVQKNLARGAGRERGTQVVHFRQSFHGRTGYTLSLTNTDPVKTDRFPKFDWPRIDNPKVTFPLEGENLRAVEQAEGRAVAQIEEAFRANPDDIAAVILEPIQGEGGDNHFRGEFLRTLRRLCDEHEALLILDEVQTGVGMTGRMWAYQHFGFEPDILCFGKKLQVCGIMASRRLDEVPDHVFRVSGRINSTWGGNLADMVRGARYLEIIEEERLVENAARMGDVLLAGLQQLGREFPEKVLNPRGRGLMCAFDLETAELRKRVMGRCQANGLMMLASGPRGIRFRPALNVAREEVEEGIALLRRSLSEALG